jgi:hypothetical protein
MEKVNFYRVQIGRTSRRGNFETIIEKVVQSTAEKNEVWRHFYNNYSELTVNIEQIQSIELLEFPKQPTPQIEVEIKPSIKRYFNGRIGIDSKDFKEKRSEVMQLAKDFERAKTELKEDVVKKINLIYSTIGRFDSFKDFDIHTSNQYFKLDLFGSFEEILEKLSETHEQNT